MKASDQIASLRESALRHAVRSDIPWPGANTLLSWLEDLRKEVEELKTKPPVFSTVYVNLERSKLRVTELENLLSVQVKNNRHREQVLEATEKSQKRWKGEAYQQARALKAALARYDALQREMDALRRDMASTVPVSAVAPAYREKAAAEEKLAASRKGMAEALDFVHLARLVGTRVGMGIDWDAFIQQADKVLALCPQHTAPDVDRSVVSEPPIQQFPSSQLNHIMTRATEGMLKVIEREVLDPVYNPAGISPTQVPEGWRMLRQSDFSGTHDLKSPLLLEYWHRDSKRWEMTTTNTGPRAWIHRGNTYITPIVAESTEKPKPAPKVLNPEKVDPAKVPAGWRFPTEADTASEHASQLWTKRRGFIDERVRSLFHSRWTYIVRK